MDRKEKIRLLKEIETGKRSAKELQPVSFLEFKEYASQPGLLFDKAGINYTKEEVNSIIEKSKETSSLTWLEIKTY